MSEMTREEAKAKLHTACDESVSDETIAMALAEEFVSRYCPKGDDHIPKAEVDLLSVLSHRVPGCLTGDQINDDDVKAMFFELTAALKGWECKKK